MKNALVRGLMFICFTVGIFTISAISADVPIMTKEELKAMLGNPDLLIFDVRLGSDYISSDLKIKGAVRPDMGARISGTLFTYPKGKTLVFYCASPNEERSLNNVKYIMEGREWNDGYTKAYVLKGGWEEWLKANYPTEKK